MEQFQPKRICNSFQFFQPSEEEFSRPSNNQHKSEKASHEQFQILYIARKRFINFVNELGELRNSRIRYDILSHCQQSSKKQKIYESYISDKSILKIINLRIEKMIKNKRIKKNWSQEDVQILIWVVSKYADKKKLQDIERELDTQDWEAIAMLIPGVTGESCMFKWLSLKKTNLATNNWSQQQSNLLLKLVNQKGFQGKSKGTKDWKMISQRLYYLITGGDKIFRNAKQCRQHWNCYLNPNLKKGPWTPQEDIQLLKCIKDNQGSKKWSQIVKYFDGRTENALKNRYTLILDKQKKHNKHKSELQIIQEYLIKSYVDQFTIEMNEQDYSPSDGQDYSPNSQQQIIVHQQNSLQAKFTTPLKELRDESRFTFNQTTPITQLKVEKFQEFLSLISAKKINLQSLRFGTLSNGIFEKAEFQEKSSLDSFSRCSSFHLKRYSSSIV